MNVGYRLRTLLTIVSLLLSVGVVAASQADARSLPRGHVGVPICSYDTLSHSVRAAHGSLRFQPWTDWFTPARTAPAAERGATHSTGRFVIAAEAGGGADFVAGSDGTVISTSRARLEGGLQSARFPANATTAPGMEYELPDGTLVRIMEPSGQAPLRASFTNENGGPINPFTGKPVQPPPGLSPAERLAYVRSFTHLELGP